MQRQEGYMCVSCSVMSNSLHPHELCTPGFPVHHQLPKLAQTHVHRVGDGIKPSHPLSSSSPIFNLSQHQGLFQWVSSSHQVSKVLELQLQHLSFQWIFRTDLGNGKQKIWRRAINYKGGTNRVTDVVLDFSWWLTSLRTGGTLINSPFFPWELEQSLMTRATILPSRLWLGKVKLGGNRKIQRGSEKSKRAWKKPKVWEEGPGE